MKSDRSGRVQYACLPWRRAGDDIEVMLITSRGTGRWVLPKGWPMVGVSGEESAAQEAVEEAGVVGRLGDTLGRYIYKKELKDGTTRRLEVEVYPLEVMTELATWKEERERTRVWLSCAQAANGVAEKDLAELIRRFDSNFIAQEEG